MIKVRSEVLPDDTWNVDAMYPSFEKWEDEFNAFTAVPKENLWDRIQQFQGKLSDGPHIVKELLEIQFEIELKLEHLYTYAHLRHDEDIAEDKYKSAFMKITVILHDYSEATSWIDPELLNLSQQKIDEYLSSNVLKDYQFYLEKTLRLKKHTLPPSEEKIMANSAKALQGYQKAFSAINDADFQFGYVLNESGEEKTLSHASFGLYLRAHDRTLRKNAFLKYHKKYQKYENTICELLQGVVQKHLFEATSRKYSSCLERALYPKNIDCNVYFSLIDAVNNRLDVLHKYMALREKVTGTSPLHLYDMYVPLIKEYDLKLTFQEAADLLVDSVGPLGSEYQNILHEGIKEKRWVDRYENKNKRSGAYSSGCYNSMPYILMNYKGVLRDVFTLAHEAGHSMHSFFSHKYQPFQYGDYPIFLAEVASTFNEDLLMRMMLERSNSKQEKIYLINSKIEDIRATLFRQTMFAEFELLIHTKIENNEPLTPQLLKDEYLAINQKYFGPNVVIDEEAQLEWARIPHFYYNFYVYQYATGISAALALSDRVMSGGDKEREDYLGFLKSGCSRYPLETLKLAGVDMSTPEPVNAAIGKFSDLVDQLEQLLDS
ncbi:MAG: oligoendopeptidase F [Chlamydiota bacterium]